MSTPTGRVITVTKARTGISDYVAANASTDEEKAKLVVGHLFDYALIKSFIESIDKLIAAEEIISGVRIYHSLSNRNGELPSKELDLVLVPAISKDDDYYSVYDKDGEVITPIILSHSTPCPNICNGSKKVSC